MDRNSGSGDSTFFRNSGCQYFPCHATQDTENFNCLFCYCPLYGLGEDCGGNYRFTASGVKDCTGCLVPHRRENYAWIMEKLRDANRRRKAERAAGDGEPRKAEGPAVHILYFTDGGEALAGAIRGGLEEGNTPVSAAHGKGRVRSWTKAHFRTGDVLLFIGAAGIAVRAVAPHLQGKDTDPAVLVCDERGRYVVPLLSGHLGGANLWAARIAKITGGQAVLTTATDVNGVFAVDVFAKRNSLIIDDLKRAAGFTAALLREKTGRLVIPAAFAGDLVFAGTMPAELRAVQAPGGGNEILLSPAVYTGEEPAPLQLIPSCIVLGMGCRKGKEPAALLDLADRTLSQLGIRREAVCALASIDVKKDEPGLCALARELGVPFETFSAETLQVTPAPEGHVYAASERVQNAVGVDNVCERAAAAAGAHRFLLGKTACDGMTICVGIRKTFLSWGEEGTED
ncbi:MAG: cobalamin biosynthesis protein [Lachnospiraceae bacterium]|nr:cobalamin biosynthesis protein [Lachnospiraceae bacterium]